MCRSRIPKLLHQSKEQPLPTWMTTLPSSFSEWRTCWNSYSHYIVAVNYLSYRRKESNTFIPNGKEILTHIIENGKDYAGSARLPAFETTCLVRDMLDCAQDIAFRVRYLWSQYPIFYEPSHRRHTNTFYLEALCWIVGCSCSWSHDDSSLNLRKNGENWKLELVLLR